MTSRLYWRVWFFCYIKKQSIFWSNSEFRWYISSLFCKKEKKKLDFCKILLRKKNYRNVGVIYITSKDNFTWLIFIFNGNLRLNYKK